MPIMAVEWISQKCKNSISTSGTAIALSGELNLMLVYPRRCSGHQRAGQPTAPPQPRHSATTSTVAFSAGPEAASRSFAVRAPLSLADNSGPPLRKLLARLFKVVTDLLWTSILPEWTRHHSRC
jgi:hypothetical protein